MKNLLWVGDAGCPSGFALATHKILDTVHKHLNTTVLGMNYRGDPDVRRLYSYDIYAANAEGDGFGVGRIIWMCDKIKPDVIVLQNDGWNIPYYIAQLRTRGPNGEYIFPEHAAIPVVAAVAVDGKNFRGKWLDGISHAIFWTQFALDEARKGGYKGSAEIIPLGVDLTTYYPEDKREAKALRFPKQFQDAFIVGNVNRNQPRKRWDLTMQYFAEWINREGIRDAYLYFHCAPTGDVGCEVKQLAEYYGILDRVMHRQPQVWYGDPESAMRNGYNCFDVQVTTTQGEGFGLTTFEGMACGVPQIVPKWASLEEICGDAALQIECTSQAIGPPYLNVIGGIADKEAFIYALDGLYRNPAPREELSRRGLARVEEDRYRWENIGQKYVDALAKVTAAPVEEEVVA